MTETCYCGQPIDVEDNTAYNLDGTEHYCMQMQEQFSIAMQNDGQPDYTKEIEDLEGEDLPSED